MSEERKVFVSYSRKDKEKVFPLVKDLEKSLGCKFWIDWTGIESGNPNFYNEIAQGIDDAKVVLYMHTTNAAKSLYTQRELAYAEKVRTKIIPVLFEDLTKGLALQFAATNFIDTRETGQIQKLINDLRGYLNLSNSGHVVPQTKPQELKPVELKPEAKPKSANGKSEERKVFVIYSMVDKDKILPLVKNLEKGVGTKFCMGMDSDNPNIPHEITQAIDDAKVVLYMHTANATRSPYTRSVLNYAAKTKKGMLIPVLLDDLKRLAMQFTAASCIDIRKAGQIQRLINDLRGYLNLSSSADRSTTMDTSATEKKEESTSAPNTIAGHQFVDLGLSVKWATCNVGANSPEEYGDYYAWGETSLKSSYTEDNCETWRKNVSDIKGTCRDVAHVKWGGSWRMPTKAEFEELVNNCVWIWTTRNGVKGYKVTGVKTGDLSNFIFLPAGGYRSGKYPPSKGHGYYWSSDKYSVVYAHMLSFSDDHKYGGIWERRSKGLSVRPVTE